MRRAVPLALVAASVWPQAAHAVRIPMSRPALCARAGLVAVGEVTGSEGRWTDDGEIETRTDVAVLRVVRGTPVSTLVVRTPGGRIGGVTETISEAPVLRTDARYLLLLQKRGGAWEIVGGADGAIPVGWDAGSEAAAVATLGDCRG